MPARRAYGEGSIHRHHDPDCPQKGVRDAKCACRWRGTKDVGLTENGKRKRITVTGKTQAEVAKRLKKKATELEGASAPDAGRKTVHLFGQDWLELRVERVRPKTYDRDALMVRKYADPALGTKRLADLTARDLRVMEARVRENGGEDYVRKIRTSFVTMLRDALSEGYVVPSAIFDSSTDTGHKRTAPRRGALEIPQAIAVLAQASQDVHYARWVAGFYQGQRQGESLGLTWDAVDLDRGLITIEWQLQALPYVDKADRSQGFRMPRDFDATHLAGRFHLVRPKTNAGWRVAPMTEEFHAALTAWREVAPDNPHGLVWTRENGWPIDKADDAEAFRELQRAAGVRKGDGLYTGHEMRNTCATILTLAGVDPATITAILGHSSWSTSLSYVTAQLDRMRSALADVNAAYKPKELG